MRMKKPLSLAISMAVLGSNALVVSNLALAQADDKEMIEEITVTGSRIKRADFESISPVTTVDSERFSLAGPLGTEQLLNQLPQVLPGLTNTSNNPGDGTASVDLRGLGSKRTMVLMNGRRMVPTGQDGTVDINNIPSSLIEKVEVVTGGASAIYGSDAIAGVVNFVMKNDFEGVEISARQGQTSEGDGDRIDLDLTFGSNFDGGKGNAVMYFGYSKRDEVFAAARKFSSEALGDFIRDEKNYPGVEPYLYPFGSSGIPGTRVFGTANFNDGTSNGGGARFTPDGNAVPYDGSTDSYNFAPVNYLQLPQERYTFNAFANYELNKNARVYGEALYVQHKTPQQLAPTPAQVTNVLFDYANSPYLTQDAKDVFANSYDSDGDGVAEITRLRRRLLENDARRSDDQLTTFRFVLGADGDITDSWSYDAYASYGKVSRITRLTGDASSSRFIQALNTIDGVTCTDPANNNAIIEGCSPIDIWGEGNISQAGIDFIQIGATNTTTYEQKVFSASITGELFSLPAGSVAAAFGWEHREEDSEFTPDTFLSTGDVLGFNSGEPTNGGFNVNELYAEIQIPVTDIININGAYRYSDYTTAGSVNTYAYGMDLTPIKGLRFRAQYQRAIRAPSVNELFLGASNGFPAYTDPCSASSVAKLKTAEQQAATKAFCVAQGIPASVIDTYSEPDGQVEATFGGNPNLQEETSDSITTGFVWQPQFLDGLSLTVDYYDIKVEDAINTAGGGANNLIDTCVASLDANSAECQAITRDANGDIVNVVALNANIAENRVKGVDSVVEYDFDTGFGIDGISNFKLAFMWSHYLENSFTSAPGTEKRECAGRFGTPCGQTITGTVTPENKIDASLTWYTGPVSARLGVSIIGEAEDARIDGGISKNDLPVPTLDRYNVWDFTGSYQLTDSIQLSGGISNLLDEEPPIYGGAAVQSNTDPSTYDVLGRRFFLGGKMTF